MIAQGRALPPGPSPSAIADPDDAARAGLRNHFRMIFYSPELRDQYMAQMGDLGYEPAVARAVSAAARR